MSEKINPKTGLTKEEELRYALHVLESNKIRPNEIEYYKGLTDRNPHGIDNSIWKEAWKKRRAIA